MYKPLKLMKGTQSSLIGSLSSRVLLQEETLQRPKGNGVCMLGEMCIQNIPCVYRIFPVLYSFTEYCGSVNCVKTIYIVKNNSIEL